MNDRIRHPEIRVLNENNEQLGIMSSRDALAIAYSKGLDLIEVAPMAKPPVCRIVDYGKFKYEQDKKKHDDAKKQKTPDLKMVKMFPNIAPADLTTKINQITRMIKEGDKVCVSIFFKGREAQFRQEHAQSIMNKIIEDSSVVGTVVEKEPMLKDKVFTVTLAPARKK